MSGTMQVSNRFTIISSDCHAGADLRDYKLYLGSAGATSSTPGRPPTSIRGQTSTHMFAGNAVGKLSLSPRTEHAMRRTATTSGR